MFIPLKLILYVIKLYLENCLIEFDLFKKGIFVNLVFVDNYSKKS